MSSIDLHVVFGLILVPRRTPFFSSSDALSLLSFRIFDHEINQLTPARPGGVRRRRFFSEHTTQKWCSRPRCRLAFIKVLLNVARSPFLIRLCWLQEVSIGRRGNEFRVSAEPPVGGWHMSSNDRVLRSFQQLISLRRYRETAYIPVSEFQSFRGVEKPFVLCVKLLFISFIGSGIFV